MVNFDKLKAEKTPAKAIDPLEIFRRLPKPPGINDLYTSQAEVLKNWFDRRTESDLVIKLHTGGGKTLVGLLIAQSVMNEMREPVVYLCPNTQLIEQTLSKAVEYGISAVQYEKGGGVPLPREFTSVRSVLVCTYNALFNARSKFGAKGGAREITKAGAIILDDAHVASSTMRDAFTLSVRKDVAEDDYLYLANLFRSDFSNVGKIGIFDDIVSGTEMAVIEVPYWAWKEKSLAVRDYLQARAEDNDYPLRWGFLRDNFDYCHCLVSSTSFALTPMFPTVDAIPTFAECSRRVYMSATINDDSMIVRTFNANPSSVAKPITSNSLAGVSERMILAPDLMDFEIPDSEDFVKETAKWMSSENKRGTVVLSSSIARANRWSDVGLVADTPEKVGTFVKNLQEETNTGPYVFANRYDGIDLPNAACRLLIMENLPQGANSYDLFRSGVFMGGEESRSEVARRIEQGIGRGARGAGDFCIVILTGSDLISWIDRPQNQHYLTQSTQAQLTIGKNVSSVITNTREVYDTIIRCLNRDLSWTTYHAETLSELVQPQASDEGNLNYATIERKAFELFRQNLFEKAIERINKYCEDNRDTLDNQSIGWLKQFAARIAFAGELPNARSLQEEAYFSNNNLHRPLHEVKYAPVMLPQSQSKAIVAQLLKFRTTKGFLANFDTKSSMLTPRSTSNQFEEALASFGQILGFATDRPDNKIGKGPDVFWLLDTKTALVLEAKNRKILKKPLDKGDHAQLLEAEHWFKSEYKSHTPTRVSIHPNRAVRYEPTTDGTKVLTFEKLNELIMAARKLIISLDSSVLTKEQLEIRCQELLENLNLTPEKLPQNFLETFLPFEE